MAGGVDDPLDGLYHLLVRLHYFGRFVREEDLLDYCDGSVVELEVEKAYVNYATILAYAQDMYHVKRGHCRGTYTYKMHWQVPGKSLHDGLMFLCDDSLVKKMESGICSLK